MDYAGGLIAGLWRLRTLPFAVFHSADNQPVEGAIDAFSGDVRSGTPGPHGGGQERSRSPSAARPSWYPTMCSSRAAPGRGSGATCCATAASKPDSGCPPAYSTPKGSRQTCCSSSVGPGRGGGPTGAEDLLPADQPALHPEGQFPATPPSGRLRGLLQLQLQLSASTRGDRTVPLVHRRRVVNRDKTNLDIFWLRAESLDYPEFTRRLSPQKESPAYPGSRWDLAVPSGCRWGRRSTIPGR